VRRKSSEGRKDDSEGRKEEDEDGQERERRRKGRGREGGARPNLRFQFSQATVADSPFPLTSSYSKQSHGNNNNNSGQPQTVKQGAAAAAAAAAVSTPNFVFGVAVLLLLCKEARWPPPQKGKIAAAASSSAAARSILPLLLPSFEIDLSRKFVVGSFPVWEKKVASEGENPTPGSPSPVGGKKWTSFSLSACLGFCFEREKRRTGESAFAIPISNIILNMDTIHFSFVFKLRHVYRQQLR
jgi:hypothetical protein